MFPSPPALPALLLTRLHDYCARYDPHPTPIMAAIHHTILAVEISCKGQGNEQICTRVLRIGLSSFRAVGKAAAALVSVQVRSRYTNIQ